MRSLLNLRKEKEESERKKERKKERDIAPADDRRSENGAKRHDGMRATEKGASRSSVSSRTNSAVYPSVSLQQNIAIGSK